MCVCVCVLLTPADPYSQALAEDHKHAPEMRGAWLAIAGAFRDRTVRSVYNRGVRLLHTGNYKGSWTADEEASLMKLVRGVATPPLLACCS